MKVINGLLVSASIALSLTARASILPPNNLYLQDGFLAGGLTQEQFNDTIDFVSAYYAPVVASYKAKLVVVRNWDDSTVNAYANRSGKTWNVNMFGGLARRPEVTVDGFTLVICHEIGHHLGGFPFVRDWAADEGQADYFATQACARNLWKNDFKVNATFASKVNAVAKTKCDARWDSEVERNLCYRVSDAGYSLATLLGALGGSELPDFSKPDTSKVSATNHAHPKAQCRLDTYLAGGLCDAQFQDDMIPGSSTKISAAEKEKQALSVSCSQFDATREFAGRPTCWFKQTIK
ncbi:MAG: hypothetical protein WCI18_11700 [Pseudomonadota bacterium]